MKSTIPIENTRGIVLIAVLIILLIITSTLTFISTKQDHSLTTAIGSKDAIQAQLLCLSAENLAKTVLSQDSSQSKYDHLDESWAKPLNQVSVDQYLIDSQIIDLDRYLNINQFTDFKPEYLDQVNQLVNSPYQIIERLLDETTAGSSSTLHSLIDWQDQDEQPLPGGAESLSYQLYEPFYRTANNALVSLNELHLVQGFDHETIQQLKVVATAMPADVRQVNINTASARVLSLLAPSIDSGLADQLTRLRSEKPFKTKQSFLTTIRDLTSDDLAEQIQAELAFGGTDLFKIKSNYFKVTSVLRVNSMPSMRCHSLLYRDDQNEPSKSIVIARSMSRSTDIEL